MVLYGPPHDPLVLSHDPLVAPRSPLVVCNGPVVFPSRSYGGPLQVTVPLIFMVP